MSAVVIFIAFAARATSAQTKPAEPSDDVIRVEKIEGAAKDMRQAIEEGLRCATLASREREPTSNWLRAHQR